MDEIERLSAGWDDCVDTNHVLNLDLGRAEDLLRMALDANMIPYIRDKIEAFLNRGW